MRFYSRDNELATLNALYQQAQEAGKMVVITGRRRIGKTALSLEFVKDKTHIYLFTSKKSEALLCLEFLETIQQNFSFPVIGTIHTFKDIFKLLIEIAKKQRIVVIIDEFQEFFQINPAVFSEIQHLWDINKNHCHLQLIFIGSVYSLMYKIFEDKKEPLFGRADRILQLSAFPSKVVAEILKDQQQYDIKLLFDYYVLSGFLPKYIEILIKDKIFQSDKIFDFVFTENSPFVSEGRNVLIEEFGRDYNAYFSILELLAAGKTARTEMESIIGKSIGGYLENLEFVYAIIKKHKPINAKPESRQVKYAIVDNFLNFWFRFFYQHRTAVEINNYVYLKQIFNRDKTTYCGVMLERFFLQLFAESGQFNHIGRYWEKGNMNEIDLVAINDLEKKMIIAEIKLNKNKHNLKILEQKSINLIGNYSKYKIEYQLLSLEDANIFL